MFIYFSDWNPIQSGCYRPEYHGLVESEETNLNHVTNTSPLMLVVSDQTHYSPNPGYAAGLYCKWHITSTSGMRVEIVDVNIFPMTYDCKYDGFVMLPGNDTASSQLGKKEV